jgi:hypothetical protein
LSGGVPHIVPRGLQAALSREWLQVTDLFEPLGANHTLAGDSQERWLITMWAVLLAVYRLGLEPRMTEFCVSNFDDCDPRPSPGKDGPALVHYCYGDDEFNKRNFTTAEDVRTTVWHAHAQKNPVNRVICEQLHEAELFYGLPEKRHSTDWPASHGW